MPIRRLTGSGSVLMLRSVISSCMPSLSSRLLATSIVLSARPGIGGIRLRNVHANGSCDCGASGSGTCPLMLSSSRLISRVSRTNRPCAPPGRRSPEVSQMQNVVPSSNVTRPLGAPIVVAGAPSNVHAWPIWCLPCGLTALLPAPQAELRDLKGRALAGSWPRLDCTA